MTVVEIEIRFSGTLKIKETKHLNHLILIISRSIFAEYVSLCFKEFGCIRPHGLAEIVCNVIQTN